MIDQDVRIESEKERGKCMQISLNGIKNLRLSIPKSIWALQYLPTYKKVSSV